VFARTPLEVEVQDIVSISYRRLSWGLGPLVALAIAACGDSTSNSSVEVATLDLSPTTMSLTIGERATITATPKAASGQLLTARTVTFTSNASNIAAVDGAGVVTGMSAGTAIITATAGGISNAVTVTVAPRARLAAGASILSFNAVVGTSPSGQVVTITNAGGGTLSGVAASVQYGSGATGWLAASLGAPTAPTTLSVQPNTTGLSAGTYTATISLTASAAENSPLTIPVALVVSAANFGVSITISGTGTGTVTSSPAGINCTITNGAVGSGACTASFASGTTVTLTAAAASGSTFTGWGGACTGSAATCAVLVIGVRDVSAAFNRAGGGAAPVVATDEQTLLTARSARLNGTVFEDGAPYTVWFEWGTSPSLATFTATGTGTGPCGGTSCAWFFDVTGLTPATAYFYRVVAQNAAGITRGSIRSLTTFVGSGAAPVISGLTSTILGVNDQSCPGSGSRFRLTITFTDANADVPLSGTPVTLSWVFQPSGSNGMAEWPLAGSTGTSSSGTIFINVCQVFGSTTSVTWSVVLRDVAGNVSNSLSVNVAKPAGSNSVSPLPEFGGISPRPSMSQTTEAARRAIARPVPPR
jgi:hypothetical protein